MEYYSINKFAKLISRTSQTLRNWDRKGYLKPNHTGPNGYRYYSTEQLNWVLQKEEKIEDNRYIVGYCRVSSNKQKEDLTRQVDAIEHYLSSLGCNHTIITDVGSGINYNKKGLRDLIKRIKNNEVSKVVVLYKDRLIRFGFELIEYIAELHNCKIEVLDYTEKTEEQELVEDLVQIVTVFACRLQGKRANKARKIIDELIDDNKDE